MIHVQDVLEDQGLGETDLSLQSTCTFCTLAKLSSLSERVLSTFDRGVRSRPLGRFRRRGVVVRVR